MAPLETRWLSPLLAGILAAMAHACARSEESDPATDAPLVVSRKAQLKYKNGSRYANDLAAALELPREAVCRELGQFDCTTETHRIALGGIEPYALGVREPLANLPVTGPIAQDRVALAACTERMDRDLAGAEPVFLTGFAAGTATRADLEALLGRLYGRVLRREVEPHEQAALLGFHSDLTGDRGSDATRDWAILSCFTVATTLEAIFY